MKKHHCDTEYERFKADLKKARDTYIDRATNARLEYEVYKANLKKKRDKCKQSPAPTEPLTDTEKEQKKLAKSKLIEIAKKNGIEYINADTNRAELFPYNRDEVSTDIEQKIPSKLQQYFFVREMAFPLGSIYGIGISLTKNLPEPKDLDSYLNPVNPDEPKYSWNHLDGGDLTFIPSHKNMGMVHEQQEPEWAFSSRDNAIKHLQSIGVSVDNIGENYDNEKEYTIITRDEMISDKTKSEEKTVFQIKQRISNGGKKSKKRKYRKRKSKKHKKSRKRKSRKASSRR